MRDVSILGVGSTRFGRHGETAIDDLAADAAREALADAGVEPERVGALYLGNFVGGMLTGQETLAGLVGEAAGLAGNVPCTKVEGACASGGIAFRHACLAVAAGLADAALAVGVEKMTHASNPRVTEALNSAMDNRADAPSGLTFPGLFGMAYRLYAQRYGATRDQVSAVVVKNKANGLSNPLAQMGARLDVDDVRDSRPIADPLRLYDCCPASDGAAAVVVVPRDAARGRNGAVDVRATVQTSGSARIAGHPDLCTFDATVAAAGRAFEDAGIAAQDLDFVELHDCFSIAEIIDSEDLGVVPRGEGAAWAGEGRTALGGDLPINPSGGLLAKGHPVGATGLSQLYEAVRQLRGDHPNQVRGARFGLAHNLGGTGVACTVSILGRPDA